ncbi:hypothetical protein LX16_1264 [Stackebrandtia albiflava]|uniref:Uncharacterized protein n=1 Tax=Stackebrandtia albiflava TaxID=406432 RepID=A0A562VCD5_9ACTN|nr:hypothetical protein [Stackebrandtia albiflava]TWJ15553.1 hypothetical protein LX16_1264 [Stackebrandtia albiflava]
MTETFSTRLGRLLDREGLEAAAAACRAEVTTRELDGVLAGAIPAPALLRGLAPTLGWHAADMFAVAGDALPEDLAPGEDAVSWDVHYILGQAAVLPERHRDTLRESVRTAPGRRPPPRVPYRHEHYEDGPGAILMRLLRNRGQSWSVIPKTIGAVTGRIWSPSTYGLIARGLKEVTPDVLGDFSAVLDVPPTGLSAVIGMEVPRTPHTGR